MLEWLSDPNAWLALITLIILEIILGIDNIIFLSLIVAKVPKQQQNMARKLGLCGAMFMRIVLLTSLAWIVRLQHPLFYIYTDKISTLSQPASRLLLAVSMRDLVLFLGGLFLIWKGMREVRQMFYVEGDDHQQKKPISLWHAIVEIMLIDIVFSLDSVITAVGLSEHLMIMIAAVVISVLLMMFAAKPIGDFVENHPTVKMVALCFLILVGMVLATESIHIEVPKGYIYFALFFSLAVETLNLLRNKKLSKTVD
jgi:predicted tellurium resistance membrane protein TerC